MSVSIATKSRITNAFAGIGVAAVLVAIGWGALHFIDWKGTCEKRIGPMASTSDSKASVYQFDCGAMAATRTYVTLSSPSVDGWKEGDQILVLVHLETLNGVDIQWKSQRLLHVSFPASAEVEYFVGKSHGIVIELEHPPVPGTRGVSIPE